MAGGFPVENEEKGKGVGRVAGVGWGQVKEPASQCARVCQNYPLAIYPLVSPRFFSDLIFLKCFGPWTPAWRQTVILFLSPVTSQGCRNKSSATAQATKTTALSLSGPLDRLSAFLSPLHPLNRYRTPSAIGSAIERPYLALSCIPTQAGVLNRFVLNHVGSSTA